MREILFRGRSLEDGEWKYGYLSQYIDVNDRTITQISPIYHECRSEYSPLPPIYDVDEQTVGQYTGYKDSRGKRIFEGDIIKIDDHYIYTVGYNDDYTMFDLQDEDAVFWHICTALSGTDKYEVIGNIHDNPELLKGGKQ
jgi:uncharacterized phage protein (TIGR01671 family)